MCQPQKKTIHYSTDVCRLARSPAEVHWVVHVVVPTTELLAWAQQLQQSL